MGSLISIRRRIRSAKNISQITRAMEMVSASKMKKAQEAALATRPFTDKLVSMLRRLSRSAEAGAHALARTSAKEQKILVLMSSTTKGLCGGLNVNLYRAFREFCEAHPGTHIAVAELGTKAKWAVPGREVTLAAKFRDLGEVVTFEESRPISRYLMDAFIRGEYDAVYMLYPKFITTLTNEVQAIRLLPIKAEIGEEAAPGVDYTIEPSPAALIDMLMPYELEMAVYQSLLESRATEHSARMVAMKSASDNAKELIANLTLDYNQARQSQVTSELLDVTTARMALE
jgi:F-type H+-transporting ATPase subunit gamma